VTARIAAVFVVGSLYVAPCHSLAAQDKVDVTGEWLVNVESDAGSGTPLVTFRQQGEALSFSYRSENFGDRQGVGTVKGGALEFSFLADEVGVVVFKGTIDSPRAIHGTLDIANGAATGSFEGTRKS
jgi:hypothetical protein